MGYIPVHTHMYVCNVHSDDASNKISDLHSAAKILINPQNVGVAFKTGLSNINSMQISEYGQTIEIHPLPMQ